MKSAALNEAYDAESRVQRKAATTFGPDSFWPAPVDHPKCEDDTGRERKKRKS